MQLYAYMVCHITYYTILSSAEVVKLTKICWKSYSTNKTYAHRKFSKLQKVPHWGICGNWEAFFWKLKYLCSRCTTPHKTGDIRILMDASATETWKELCIYTYSTTVYMSCVGPRILVWKWARVRMYVCDQCWLRIGSDVSCHTHTFLWFILILS